VQVRNSQFEKSLLNKIARVTNGLEREVEIELKVSFSLTFSQFRVLDALAATGEVSQKDLATRLEVTPAVVTRQAEVLSAKGLLLQRANPRSKRENVLVLTSKGEAAAMDATKAVQACQTRYLSPLKVQDETALERAIETLSKALDS
jgi:DNA-binding MarR family transcriptional regulator